MSTYSNRIRELRKNNSEKRMFWRGIIERIEYGNDKRFTVRFVR